MDIDVKIELKVVVADAAAASAAPELKVVAASAEPSNPWDAWKGSLENLPRIKPRRRKRNGKPRD
jgi:hypothetical protein